MTVDGCAECEMKLQEIRRLEKEIEELHVLVATGEMSDDAKATMRAEVQDALREFRSKIRPMTADSYADMIHSYLDTVYTSDESVDTKRATEGIIEIIEPLLAAEE